MTNNLSYRIKSVLARNGLQCKGKDYFVIVSRIHMVFCISSTPLS